MAELLQAIIFGAAILWHEALPGWVEFLAAWTVLGGTLGWIVLYGIF